MNPNPLYVFAVMFVAQAFGIFAVLNWCPEISDSELVHADVCPRAPGSSISIEQCAANDRTFYFRMPSTSYGGGFSRWQHPIRAIFQLTEQGMKAKETATDIVNVTMNVQLSYSDNNYGHWRASSANLAFITVKCKKLMKDVACDPIPILIIEYMKHPFYMMSVQLLNMTQDLKVLGVSKVMLKVVTQNETFSKFWILVKIFLTCFSGFILYMFLGRMKAAERAPTFSEKILRLLLVSLFVQHWPLEQVMTILGLPFGTSLSVLTSGVFFSTLFAAWLTSACECMPVPSANPEHSTRQRTSNSVYYIISCAVVIIFNMYETAMRTINPYYNTGDDLIDSITIINAICGAIMFICVMYAHITAWRASRARSAVDRDSGVPPRDKPFILIMIVGLLCALHGAGSFVLADITNTQYALASWKWPDLSTALQGKTYYYVWIYFTWSLYVYLLVIKYLPETAMHRQLAREGPAVRPIDRRNRRLS